MRIAFFLISLFCFANLAPGQQAAIRGKITSNGLPVKGATVTASLGGREASDVTGQRGEYNILVASPGEYSLIVIDKGLEVYSGTATAVAEGSGISLTLDIELPGIREVVNVAADQLETTEQVSKTIDVIDGQQMRDRADFSLAESARTIPGFRIQQLGGFGKTANIKTRGLRNQDTALLIDGIRFRDPTAITGDASPFISDLTLTSVDRIEVLRGSGSSLYGTNAVGGVLDFQTPSARRGTHGHVGGAFGGLGLARFRGNVSHGANSGKFGVVAGVSRTVYTRGIDGDDDAHNTNLQGRIDGNPSSMTDISGRVFFSDADVRLNVSPDTRGTLPASTSTVINAVPGVTFAPDANDPDARQSSRFFTGQFVVSHVLTPKLMLNGYYQGLATRRRNTDGPLGPGFQSAFTSLYDGSIHTANAHLGFAPNSKNTLTAGFEFEQERFRNDNAFGADISSARAIQRSHTFYVHDVVSVLDGRLRLAGGFRVQSFGLGTPRFSATAPAVLTQRPSSIPNATTLDGAVSYFFESTQTKLRAHVGNGYRVPSLYERFGSYFFLGQFFPLGNPALKPEHSTGADAGIEQFLTGQRVRLSATWFYTRIKDEITFLPTANVNESSYYNADRHFSRGAEASVSVRPNDRTDLFASYTFTNSDVRAHSRPTFPPGPVTSAERRAFGIPEHQFTLVATQRFARAWVNFDLLVTSDYLAQIFSNTAFNNYTYRFRGNRRGDVTVGYTFGLAKEKRTVRVYGTVENVFDNEYYENGFRTAGINARVGATFGF